jgi:hypothetical protein
MNANEVRILKEYYEEHNNKVNGMKLKKWFEQHNDVKQYLEEELKSHPNLTNISNIIGCLVNDIDLNSFNCKVCGKQLKIKNWTIERKYCSTKCAMNDPELQKRKTETIASDPDYWKRRQEKIIKTNLERYGAKTPAQNKEIAKKMSETCAKDPDHWKNRNEKSKQTCLKRYGVENASSTNEVREKVKQANLKKFGVDNPNKLPETLEKVRKTCLEKYGVDCQFKRKEVIETTIKKSWEKILTWTDFVTPLFTFVHVVPFGLVIIVPESPTTKNSL